MRNLCIFIADHCEQDDLALSYQRRCRPRVFLGDRFEPDHLQRTGFHCPLPFYRQSGRPSVRCGYGRSVLRHRFPRLGHQLQALCALLPGARREVYESFYAYQLGIFPDRGHSRLLSFKVLADLVYHLPTSVRWISPVQGLRFPARGFFVCMRVCKPFIYCTAVSPRSPAHQQKCP